MNIYKKGKNLIFSIPSLSNICFFITDAWVLSGFNFCRIIILVGLTCLDGIVTEDGNVGCRPEMVGLELQIGHDYNSSPSTLMLLPSLCILLPFLLECGEFGIVRASGPRLLCTSLSKRKNSWRTRFSRPVQYAVFFTRVIALDIHWMARLWKTITKKHSSRRYIQ